MSKPASRPSSQRKPSGERTPGPEAEPAEDSEAPEEHFVQMKSPQSLQRLRDRVEQAVRELERLREENRGLQQRLQDLEARPVVDAEGTVVTFDEDPEQLRRTIQGFIASIDRYLEEENPPS